MWGILFLGRSSEKPMNEWMKSHSVRHRTSRMTEHLLTRVQDQRPGFDIHGDRRLLGLQQLHYCLCCQNTHRLTNLSNTQTHTGSHDQQTFCVSFLTSREQDDDVLKETAIHSLKYWCWRHCDLICLAEMCSLMSHLKCVKILYIMNYQAYLWDTLTEAYCKCPWMCFNQYNSIQSNNMLSYTILL